MHVTVSPDGAPPTRFCRARVTVDATALALERCLPYTPASQLPGGYKPIMNSTYRFEETFYSVNGKVFTIWRSKDHK